MKWAGMSRIVVAHLFAIVFFVAGHGILAAEEAAAPVHIEADRMESDRQRDSVLFTGNVEARQGGLIIQADEMVVHYLPPGTNQSSGEQSQKIKKIFAKGNVKISKEGWAATGDTLEFFSKERKVELTGNTTVWQDNNTITGESIVLFLDEGKSIVQRSSKKGERVQAFFYPGGGK